MAVLPGVLGCRSLRRTAQVRLETNTLRLPGGRPTLVVSRQQFMKHPDYQTGSQSLSFKIIGVNLTIAVVRATQMSLDRLWIL